LTTVFLRLYAFNLNRSFRSSAPQACGDALLQMIMLLILPLWLLLGLLGARFRGSALIIHLGNVSFILVTAALALPLNLWALRQFSRYRSTPAAAARYCSTGERYKSAIVFTVIPIVILAVLALAI